MLNYQQKYPELGTKIAINSLLPYRGIYFDVDAFFDRIFIFKEGEQVATAPRWGACGGDNWDYHGIYKRNGPILDTFGFNF